MKELLKYARKMVEGGLTHSHLGNVSLRQGEQLIISSAGSRLDELENHLVTLPIYQPSPREKRASSELPLHREIYKQTSARAILHGHPPFSVIVSLTCPEEVIVPYDCEGKYLLQEIPVIAGEPGSAELAARAARALREHKGAIIKGHGVLATGQSVKEAYTVLSSIEHSCQVKYYVELGQRKVKPREEIWAPWRIGYILEEKPQGCFLCEKPAEQRDTENYILHRGEKNFLLLNTYPYNPGHLMVAPYRHVGDLEKLTPEERREHFEMVIQGVTLLKKVLSPQGFNLGLNLGRTAGAGVEAHLHTHIVPRWEGDTNYMPVLADTKVIPEALAATYHKLKHSFNPPL